MASKKKTKKTPVKKARKPATRKSTRKRIQADARPSAKHAAYEMLRDPGKAGPYLQSLELSRDSVLNLAKALVGHDALLAHVDKYREARGYPALGEGKGRGAPQAGEERGYRNQQGNAGGPYIRLPLEVLGAVKGGTTKVKFEKSKITVTRD